MIPELNEEILAISGYAVFLFCLYTWFCAKEYEALSWGLVALAIALTYSWITIYEPPLEARAWLVRADLVAVLFNIVYWRVSFIIIQTYRRRKVRNATTTK